jgi:ribosomal protein L11 methyltransferase
VSWPTITLIVPDALKDAIVGEFSSDGIAGVWERPAGEGAQVELVLYFDRDTPPPLVSARVGRVFERNGFTPPVIAAGRQEKEDWALEWRRGFTSFPIGNRFRVVPSWESPAADDERLPIRIDPGLAFGTGTHETTQLVIEALESIGLGELHEGVVFDLGTGSAILSIAAVLLGAKGVIACDVDADAVQVARDNLRRNHTTVPVFVGSIDAVGDGAVGVLLANLTADVIEDTVAGMARALAPGGRAIFSGILDTQAGRVAGRLAAEGIRVVSTVGRGEWVAMVGHRGD